jgi:hypothetical protein
VDLQELIGSNMPSKRRPEFDEQDPSRGETTPPSGDESHEADQLGRIGEFSSVEELLQAYNNAKALLQEKTIEADRYPRDTDGMGNHGRLLAQHANDEAFMRQIRDYYDKDPFSATDAMIHKAQEDIMSLMEMRLAQTFHQERHFGRALDDFLSDPANARLRPYSQELEFLIREKGLNSGEAAALLHSLEDKRESAARKRSAAAKEVRNRAAVETDGEIGEPLDVDRKLNQVIKKSKNLDEMFSGLRKLKL